VLLAETEQVDRWQQQATEQLLQLLDELAHLVWSPKMLVCGRSCSAVSIRFLD